MISAIAKRVSISQVAEAAGVSAATVSLALNGKGRINPQTRLRIVETAERLGYRPNAQARGLATGRTMTIALQLAGAGTHGLIPDFSYFVEILNAASAAALRRGYGMVVLPADEAPELLAQLPMDGAIVVDPTGDEALLDREGLAIVTAGRVPDRREQRMIVDNDHRAGTRAVLDHLWEAGCRRPALLTTMPGQSYVDDAATAYAEWCSERRLEPRIARVREAPTETAAESVVADLLRGDSAPDAIHATLDRAAVGALTVARDLGLGVPDDLAIAATTDSSLLRAVDPPITALNLNPAQIGSGAVELLLREIEGGDSEAARELIVPSELVPRASTAKTGG
jgi:DNA-binding LacI/PurR family transcriptional regulator